MPSMASHPGLDAPAAIGYDPLRDDAVRSKTHLLKLREVISHVGCSPSDSGET